LVKASILANRHSEPWSRSNLTRTYFTHQLQSQGKCPSSKSGNIVLSRNVSAKVLFDNPVTRTISRQCRPRFSFFCIKLSKNRQSQNRRKLTRLTPRPNLNHQNLSAQTLNFVSLRLCGAGYLIHSANRVNPFFSRNSQPYQPFLPQYINKASTPSTPPNQTIKTEILIA